MSKWMSRWHWKCKLMPSDATSEEAAYEALLAVKVAPLSRKSSFV